MSKSRNRLTTIAGAGAVVVLISVAGAAYAASLTVSSSDLGAGRDDVGTCQTGTVTTDWVPNTNVVNTGAGWTVASVRLSGVSTACATKVLYVTLVNGAGTVLGSGQLAVPADPTTPFSVNITPVSAPLLASDVAKVDLLIPS